LATRRPEIVPIMAPTRTNATLGRDRRWCGRTGRATDIGEQLDHAGRVRGKSDTGLNRKIVGRRGRRSARIKIPRYRREKMRDDLIEIRAAMVERRRQILPRRKGERKRRTSKAAPVHHRPRPSKISPKAGRYPTDRFHRVENRRRAADPGSA